VEQWRSKLTSVNEKRLRERRRAAAAGDDSSAASAERTAAASSPGRALGGALTSPKSGKVRSVPLAPEVAQALAKLATRKHFTSDDDLVFAGETGSYLDGSVLRRRYKQALKRAGLRPQHVALRVVTGSWAKMAITAEMVSAALADRRPSWLTLPHTSAEAPKQLRDALDSFDAGNRPAAHAAASWLKEEALDAYKTA
jgi:hypothetical protein